MIVSASRRTDIPALYADWLFARMKDSYANTRNPMNPRQVRRVPLTPDEVDAIVFWSKNPQPMLDRLRRLSGFCTIFQFTLNGYGPDIEPGLPPLLARVDTFRRLADAISPARMLWRYDPILVSPRYPIHYHEDTFGEIAHAVGGSTQTVTISFIDFYRKVEKRLHALGVLPPPDDDKRAVAAALAPIALESGLRIQTCAEALDLSAFSVQHGACIDARLIENLLGHPPGARKDPNQRPACGCAASVDIGAYDTCSLGCAYCYANAGKTRAHDPASPFLATGTERESEAIE